MSIYIDKYTLGRISELEYVDTPHLSVSLLIYIKYMCPINVRNNTYTSCIYTYMYIYLPAYQRSGFKWHFFQWNYCLRIVIRYYSFGLLIPTNQGQLSHPGRKINGRKILWVNVTSTFLRKQFFFLRLCFSVYCSVYVWKKTSQNSVFIFTLFFLLKMSILQTKIRKKYC